MTIKEIENETGMARSNIRFYETEGLLNPQRNSNGYRDYSAEDLETLMKIKLLRELRLPLEEIKTVSSGECDLESVMKIHLVRLENEQKSLEDFGRICRSICTDKADYGSLNARYYLNQISDTDAEKLPETEDVIVPVGEVWRRFLARSLDMSLYYVLWMNIPAFLWNVNMEIRSAGGHILDIMMVYFIMLALEPVFLSLTGTTPGKWILGLYIRDERDKCLPYQRALRRTWQVFLYGMGLGIPVWKQISLWKSWNTGRAGEESEWDYNVDSIIVLRSRRVWGSVLYVCAVLLLAAVRTFIWNAAGMPEYRGDISVAEFCANYNKLADYYEKDTFQYLDVTGKWAEQDLPEHSVLINVSENVRPQYLFTEENGVMTGMEFELEVHGDDRWIYGYRDERILSVLSFVQAQENYPFCTKDVRKVINCIRENPYEDFCIEAQGIVVTCEVDYEGYELMNAGDQSILFPKEDENGSFVMRFSMVRDK